MNQAIPSTLNRFETACGTFLCVRMPDVESGKSFEEHLAASINLASVDLNLDGGAPTLLYWDARLLGEAAPTGDHEPWLRLGRGGLDPILAGELDLSRTVAVNEAAFRRLLARRAIKDRDDLPRAVALLARSPGLRAVWCEGLTGEVDPGAPAPLLFPHGPATHADALSLAILVSGPEVSVEPFFAALGGQAITGRLDVLVLALGHESQTLKQLARTVEKASATDPRLNVRRYSIAGETPLAYLANMAVGLANHDAVVLVDARCVPVTANAIQRLADWSISGDAAAACPRVIHKGRLAAAGLAFVRADDGTDRLAPWTQHAGSASLRTAAAPAPWFFGLNRSRWLAAGGLRAPGGGLWTSEFAGAHGPRGRTFLVGAEIVEWTGPSSPGKGETAIAHHNRQAAAATALRDPTPSGSLVDPLIQPSRGALPISPVPVAGFSDPFPNSAATKVLVFADRLGASQAIAFIDGLADARRQGSVAVRIVEEAAFPGDGRALDEPDVGALVATQFGETRPDVVVASRLGHAGVWRAVRANAARDGVPILFHVDDDILGLPVCLGVERYRVARSPKRSRTFRDILQAADLVLAATPALAAKLRLEAGHDRFFALDAGCAGRPAPRTDAARPEVVIGYMGSASHDHDLALVAPALNRIAADYDHVRFVAFGSIAEQPVIDTLLGRVERRPAEKGDYGAFRQRLADLRFDIGLAPLVDDAFNRVKTPTKWAEYAEAGAATLASPVAPYLPMIAAGAALGAPPLGWEPGLRRLIEQPALRADIVARADLMLLESYGWDRLAAQVLDALAHVRRRPARAA